MANFVYHPAQSRGFADHGWLQTHHTFSFGQYYDRDRMGFGVLRVLNDDTVQGGMGFGTHPHDNMEIISIPLEGDLEHRDSMGNTTVIRHGDIQVMSAGRGVLHSEYNGNPDRLVKFLQIWVFPNRRNVEPRYDQITLEPEKRHNRFQQILSPNPDDEGVWIHQEAWFHLGQFDAGTSSVYELKRQTHGVYVFVLKGDVHVETHQLHERDGLGLSQTERIQLKADAPAEILLMEIPMHR